MGRWPSDREDEFFYLKLVLGLVVAVLVVVALIEWNARRQAAAMTRELLRPPTPEEMATQCDAAATEPRGRGVSEALHKQSPVLTASQAG
jgi:hypothetical protein